MIKRKIEAMHENYGTIQCLRCKDCINFIHYQANRVRFKCLAYGDSNSEATDWRAGHEACGLFNIKFDAGKNRPLIETLKGKRDVDFEPMENQMSLEQKEEGNG